VAQLYGRDMFDILENGAGNLAVLDEFSGKITPGFMAKLEYHVQCIDRAEAAFEKAEAYNPLAMQLYSGGYQLGLKIAKGMVAKAEKNPDFHSEYKDHIAVTVEHAGEDVGFDEAKDDILVTPVDMLGGKLMSSKRKLSPGRRFYTILYGSDSAVSDVSFKFECDPFPPEGPYELHLSGQDDEDEGSCVLRVTLNGKIVFEKNSSFESAVWKIEVIELPFELLKRYNEILVENASPGVIVSGPPYVLLNYAVIKKIF